MQEDGRRHRKRIRLAGRYERSHYTALCVDRACLTHAKMDVGIDCTRKECGSQAEAAQQLFLVFTQIGTSQIGTSKFGIPL